MIRSNQGKGITEAKQYKSIVWIVSKVFDRRAKHIDLAKLVEAKQ